jgi:hypothetical protein
MTKVSKSPERHTFQKEGYVKRQEEKGEPVNENYLDWFEQVLEEHNNKFNDPQSRVNNMEYDLLTTDWILEKVRSRDSYAQNLYAAMCNNGFIKLEVIPILKEEEWGVSWRYAGGIVADMLEKGDYIDWYCSGMGGLAGGWNKDEETFQEWQTKTGYVPEGCITEEIRIDLQSLGWGISPDGDWVKFE